jgi:cobalamin biosynthesis protein CobT
MLRRVNQDPISAYLSRVYTPTDDIVSVSERFMQNTPMLPLSYHTVLWYNTGMLMKTTTVNRATKDILAKCMAMEDLRVIHDKNAETAYFDTKNRVLCLPVWKDMSNSTYDMLVGHEVSHALHTPQSGWEDFVGKGKGSQIRHMFLNIVEDARIERMIKDKFPGLRRDFATAYGELHTQDLFQLNNRTIDLDVPLIDRLNLHFKLGLFGLETIPFADDENQYVTRMANTVTFEDVVALAQDLYGKHADELEDEEEETGSQSKAGEGEEGEQGSQGQSGDDQGEEQDGSQSGSESEDGDEDGENEGSGSESGQSQDDDTDDGESADSEDGESQEAGDSQASLEYDDYKEGVGQAGSTQNSFEQGVNQLRDDNTRKTFEYHTLPTMQLENCVVDYKEVASMWETFESQIRETRMEQYQTKRNETNVTLRDFQTRTKSTVAQMVQHFQMKQAADASKRTDIAKTGVLDTVNMINYRWSEDIFMKNEVHADGKNHGIVMYLDWSGSMCGIIKDTVEQLLILTEFCQKVNIPFDVYAFSSKDHPSMDSLKDDSGKYLKDENGYSVPSGNHQYKEHEDNSVLRPHGFSMLQFLSSDMKKNEYTSAVQNLYYLASSQANYGCDYPNELGMGCTPLNEAIMCAMTQVPAFQKKHNVQIVNTVFLTDGDGHGMGAGRGYGEQQVVIHDPKTRKDYTVSKTEHTAETNEYLRILQERTGSNIIGIRLSDAKNVSRLQYRYFPDQDMSEVAKSWKTNNFVTVNGLGYDKLFIVRGNLQVETEAPDALDVDASYAKIKNAFMKGSNNQKSSRVIATQIVDIIAA